MKKSIKKIISTIIMTTTILGIFIVPANAEWKQNSTGYWYSNGNSWFTNWNQIDGKWYYFSPNGYMKSNSWQQEGDKWYFLKPNGSMAQNETYNGYNFENNGVWNQNYNVDSNNTTNSSVNNTATTNSNNSSNSNVSNTFDSSTNNSGNTTLNNTGTINFNDNSKTTNNVNVTVDNTSKEEKSYYKNQNSAMKTYYEEQLKQAKKDLEEAQSNLNNVKSQKTTKVSEQQIDGTFKYVGVVDQSKLQQAERVVKSAESNVEYYEKLLKQYS